MKYLKKCFCKNSTFVVFSLRWLKFFINFEKKTITTFCPNLNWYHVDLLPENSFATIHFIQFTPIIRFDLGKHSNSLLGMLGEFCE